MKMGTGKNFPTAEIQASPHFLGTLFHTVRHLRAGQVVNRITRRVRRRPSFPAPGLRERAGVWTAPVAHVPAALRKASRLREYTTHYHYQPAEGLVREWMRENPPGRGAGWEPYPLSIRIVNWIQWLLSGAVHVGEVLGSLAAQAEYLSRNVEYHLLANHLFANAKARSASVTSMT